MFENMFIKTSDVHNYSTRLLWNSLCNSIPTDCATSTYKQKLKAFFSVMTFTVVVWCYFIATLLLFFYFYIIIIIITTTVAATAVTATTTTTHYFRIVIHLVPCTMFLLTLYYIYVYMNLGHISPYFCPHCQSCDFIVLIKINAIPANITDNCCPLSWIVYLYDWLIFFVQLWQ